MKKENTWVKKAILHICNFLCSLTLIPRDLGLKLMRCFLAKTKDNAKATSNIKFSHSCKSWNKIFECFPKNFVTRKWNYKSCRRLRLFVIIRQGYVVYDIVGVFCHFSLKVCLTSECISKRYLFCQILEDT